MHAHTYRSEVVQQFEWFLNGQLVWSDEGMAATANPGIFHSYYPVVDVGPGDEGTYSCTVTLVGGASVGPMVIRHLTVLGEGGGERGEGGTHGHQTSHCAR